MKRMILTGSLALATGLACLAQQQAKPAPPAQAQPPQQQLIPGTKSEAESQAVMALAQAQQQGPDAVIKAADELVTKFVDTTFKEQALLMEAGAYKDKKDSAKAQIYLDQVLAVNPKNYQATLLMGDVLVGNT